MNTLIQNGRVTAGSSDEPATDDVLLTAEEVAALLQVTVGWVYAQTRARRIPHLRLGRYVRYRRSTLEGWMSEVEQASGDHRPPRRR
jgi:excisionase family DNA binding protein